MSDWDVRTTDLWVHQLDSQFGTPIKSWNILSDPTIPSIPLGGFVRIDVRVHNYTKGHVNVRLVLQTIGRTTGNMGNVIYSNFTGDLAPEDEFVLVHWVPMWGEDVYERLWLDNAYASGPNCQAGAAPPWPLTCRQGELYDFALSSRHLIAINMQTGGGGITPTVTVSPNQIGPGGHIQVMGVGFTPNGEVLLAIIFSDGAGAGYISTAADSVGNFVYGFVVPLNAPNGTATVDAQDFQTSTFAPTITFTVLSDGGGQTYIVTIRVVNAQQQPVPGATVNLT